METLFVTILLLFVGGFCSENSEEILEFDLRAEFNGTNGDDVLGGGSDNDVINAFDGQDMALGGNGDDKLDGGLHEDNLQGGPGNDLIYGRNDSDIIFGESGDDEIYGGRGSDYIDGGSGDDFIDGGPDYDSIVGGSGNDTLLGGPAHDIMFGQSGDDFMDGGIDNDYLDGGDGNDSIFGGLDSDTLIGGQGNDILYGEDGEDDLRGGEGRDYLVGGDGNDFLSGEENPDTYEFSGFFGHDRVYIGVDIDYPGVAIFKGSNPQELFFRQNGSDLVISKHYSSQEEFAPHYESVTLLGWYDPSFLREIHLVYTTEHPTTENLYTTQADIERLASDMKMIVWSQNLSKEDVAMFYEVNSIFDYWYCLDPNICTQNTVQRDISADQQIETPLEDVDIPINPFAQAEDVDRPETLGIFE